MINRIKRLLYHIWFTFFSGMKSADESTLGKYAQQEGDDVSLNEVQHENRVSEDLLAGKETQQVRELRYRTYAVDREAKKYEYFSPYLSKKRDTPKDIPNIYDRSDGLDVIVIQENWPITENLLDGLSQVGSRGGRQKYWIEIDRGGSFIPRYRLEEYTKRIVVKRHGNDENNVIIEFYVSRYPNDEDLKSKGFISEITHLSEDLRKNNDITSFKTLSFMTSNAWGADDLVEFRFKNPHLLSIGTFGGDFVIKVLAGVVVGGHDLMDEYYEKSIADKYARHETRHVSTTVDSRKKEYRCEECGKVVVYDPEMVNRADEGYDSTEYLDMQITMSTVGKCLCRDCLNKLTKNVEEWKKKDMPS